MADKDFIICGFEPGNMVSLILGEYKGGQLKYAGTVTMGVRREILQLLQKGSCPFQSFEKADGKIVWCRPEKVCTVEYMPNTLNALRQPVFKGIRVDVDMKAEEVGIL